MGWGCELVLEDSLGFGRAENTQWYPLGPGERSKLRLLGDVGEDAKMNYEIIKARTKGICYTSEEHVLFAQLMEIFRIRGISVKCARNLKVTYVL